MKLKIPKVPHLIHIETTYRCNSNNCGGEDGEGCVFCYNPLRGMPFVKKTMDQIVWSIYNSWVPHIYLIGGEPSLLGVRQLNKYIELLSERSSVTIVTNGLLYLDGLSNKLACIGIPIHGNQEMHECHTKEYGGYLRTIESARRYIAFGFDVRCIPVLTAWNYNQMYDIIHLASQLHMESVFVDRYEDGGLGSKWSSELKPSIEQFQVALGQMIQARDDFGISVGFGTAIPYCLDKRLITEKMSANCGAGITFAAVNPNGDVRICNQSPIVYGNVLDEPIERIWQKKNLNEFRDLSWVTEPCLSCVVLKDCICGCKVDCSCSSGYCVDYAVRGSQNITPVSYKSSRKLSGAFPKKTRQLRVDRYLKLNTFHKRETYLVTRYQTILLDKAAAILIKAILRLNSFNEEVLIRQFADSVEEAEIRRFVSKLLVIGAIQEDRRP